MIMLRIPRSLSIRLQNPLLNLDLRQQHGQERIQRDHKWAMNLPLISVAFLLFCVGSAAAANMPVDLELVLAVDVSGSMDDDEHQLQKQGYIDAFRHPDLIRAIKSGSHGRIAVTYIEWGGPDDQVIVVPWQIITDQASALRFSEALAAKTIALIRGTSISGGILFSIPLITTNNIRSTRQVIDISGDGPNNSGVLVTQARDMAANRGIVINGLPLMIKPSLWDSPHATKLDRYYNDCVIVGAGAFVLPVRRAGDLQFAIRRKLVLEISETITTFRSRLIKVKNTATDCTIGEKMRGPWDEW